MSQDTAEHPALAGDLLWGADAIGRELGLTERKAFYQLERGNLPARKIGGLWVASRAKLRELFHGEGTAV